MKKVLALVLSLVMVFAFTSIASAATVLKLSEVHADGYPTALADAEFARLVAEKTEGRITIDVYTGGTLYGQETEAIEAMQLGDLAFARVSASPVGSYVPAINAIQMPYLYKSAAHMWAVLNGEIGQKMLADIETATNKDGNPSGIVGLCYYDAGSRSFYLTKEVHSVADMAGLKIRVQNNPMMVDMVAALGATGVTGIGPNDVYASITQKVIDGAENNWPTYQNMGDYEAAPYYILDQHTRVPEILLASKAVKDTIDPADWAIIQECAKSTQEFEIEKWAEKEASSEKIVRDAGTTVIELTAEERQGFEDAMSSLYQTYGADYTDIINQIKEIGKDF
ncbi:MAG TPA: TRAP transporter substrate-binding protein [Candidatus Limiplasma sp.]|nr:TRAP transporter substrate-binding protein [Candidatus Limiplasma sp.]HPS82037.1 TRAP transporter substrate-binding protein [Candidatus Limiplasma sp.]